MVTRCHKTLMHITEATLVEEDTVVVTSRHHKQDSNHHNSHHSSNKSGLATNSESISWVNVTQFLVCVLCYGLVSACFDICLCFL